MRKQQEPEKPQGAPEWMVTFSDCMTLLLTFFVLLLSFSSFDEHIFRKLSIIFAEALPSVRPEVRRDKDAFLPATSLIYKPEVEQGSEKPTLEEGSEENLKEEAQSLDFRRRKIFLSPSQKVFWGKGTFVSRQGRDYLAKIAAYLREEPSRIVISENGQAAGEDVEHFGLLRAWAVLEYLTTEQGLDKSWFSISEMSTVTPQSFSRDESDDAGEKAERMLEIVLLERSIYN